MDDLTELRELAASCRAGRGAVRIAQDGSGLPRHVRAALRQLDGGFRGIARDAEKCAEALEVLARYSAEKEV